MTLTILDPPLPESSPFRPHCDKCGRFVQRSTVRTVTHWEGLDHDEYAKCTRCGEVGVTWAECAT